jgi:hypothetical protein
LSIDIFLDNFVLLLKLTGSSPIQMNWRGSKCLRLATFSLEKAASINYQGWEDNRLIGSGSSPIDGLDLFKPWPKNSHVIKKKKHLSKT